MKKVIGIIGSLRKESIHRVLFNEYRELSASHFEMIEGPIRDLPLYDGDIDGERTPASVQELAKLTNDANGVIFFSPEYNYSVPGVLKNAIDWLSRSSLNPLKSKPAAIVGASPGNVGTARMQYHLRQIGVFLDLQFLNKPEVMIGKAFDQIQDGKLTNDRTRDHLKKQIVAFDDLMKA